MKSKDKTDTIRVVMLVLLCTLFLVILVWAAHRARENNRSGVCVEQRLYKIYEYMPYMVNTVPVYDNNGQQVRCPIGKEQEDGSRDRHDDVYERGTLARTGYICW